MMEFKKKPISDCRRRTCTWVLLHTHIQNLVYMLNGTLPFYWFTYVIIIVGDDRKTKTKTVKKKTRNIPKRTVLILPDNISQCTGLVLRGFFKFTGQTCHRDPCRRRHRRQQRMGYAGAAGDCDDDDDERTPRGEQRDTPPRGAPVGRRRRSRQRDRTYFLFKLESCHSRCLFIVSKPH